VGKNWYEYREGLWDTGRQDGCVKGQRRNLLQAWWMKGVKRNKIRITTNKCTAGNIGMGHIFWDVLPL